MRFNRKETQAMLARLPQAKQVLFALLCAERMQACCWAFGQKEAWDVAAYVDGCAQAFEALADGRQELRQLDLLRQRLDKAIPRSDEHGYPLAIQAQSGMVALLSTLDLWESGDTSEGAGAAAAVVDALDNYEYFVRKSLTGASVDPEEYALLDREIEWQAESIKRLGRSEAIEHETAVALRLVNRSFAVPPAV